MGGRDQAGHQARVSETPSNPTAEVFDITAIAEMSRKVGAVFAVDNCFCTPILQRPLVAPVVRREIVALTRMVDEIGPAGTSFIGHFKAVAGKA